MSTLTCLIRRDESLRGRGESVVCAPRSGQLSSLTVDDNGGMRDRDGRVEPGDDRDSDIYVAGFEGGHDDGWDDSGA